MDVVGKERLARTFRARKLQETCPMESVVIDRREVYDDWTRVRMEWTIIRGDSVRVFTINHTVYSGQELKDRLTAVGFGMTSGSTAAWTAPPTAARPTA